MAVAPDAVDGGAVVRSPPDRRPFTPEELTAPKVPTTSKSGRIPILAAIAPVAIGLLMFAVTGQAQSLLFVFLSPMMLLANAAEGRLSSRRGSNRARPSSARSSPRSPPRAERSSPPRPTPGAASTPTPPNSSQPSRSEHRCCGRGDPTRTTSPSSPSGGAVSQPARTTFVSASADGHRPELVAELDEALASMRMVDDVPVAIDLVETGSIGVAGPAVQARPIVATMVVSAAMLHSPAEFSIALFASEAAAPDWEWLRWLPHVDARHSPIDSRHLASTVPSCAALHERLTALLDAREHATRNQRTAAPARRARRDRRRRPPRPRPARRPARTRSSGGDPSRVDRTDRRPAPRGLRLDRRHHPRPVGDVGAAPPDE